jgi:hypothetical protein
MSYHDRPDNADVADEDRPQPYKVPKRYRKYNQQQRKAHAKRLQQYRKYNEERRREHDCNSTETK